MAVRARRIIGVTFEKVLSQVHQQRLPSLLSADPVRVRAYSELLNEVTDVRLEGWNSIPDGYGASFDTKAAPWWLRLWFSTPFLDRFAYPIMVRRGFGHLALMPGHRPGPARSGWKIDPAGGDLSAEGQVLLPKLSDGYRRGLD